MKNRQCNGLYQERGLILFTCIRNYLWIKISVLINKYTYLKIVQKVMFWYKGKKERLNPLLYRSFRKSPRFLNNDRVVLSASDLVIVFCYHSLSLVRYWKTDLGNSVRLLGYHVSCDVRSCFDRDLGKFPVQCPGLRERPSYWT